ncbi:hypothetical protein P6B95_05810 [Streptomyces atratus]|nr:hypothetical protein [Streptomyces atratus]WPW26965.1 hypothetical protein P6B95_05810 [Streptomyces atratus]
MVPGTGRAALAPDESFRERLEMDSPDFLDLAEALSEQTALLLQEAPTA